MPLLKIGGWVFTKISKSKTQKFPYHLHHATISRFTQPHPTISPTPFLTNHPSQITPYFHPTHHKYSPHPNHKPASNPPQSTKLSTQKISSTPPRVSPKSTFNLSKCTPISIFYVLFFDSLSSFSNVSLDEIE